MQLTRHCWPAGRFIVESLEQRLLLSGTPDAEAALVAPAIDSAIQNVASHEVQMAAGDLLIWSWEPVAEELQEIIQPMTVLDRSRAWAHDPQAAAERLIAQRYDPFALLIKHDLRSPDGSMAFDRMDPVLLVQRALTMDQDWLDPHREYYLELFQLLARAGVRPERIVLDQEAGLNTWHLFDGVAIGPERVAIMERIYAGVDGLPESVTGFQPDDYWIHNGTSRSAYIAWNQFAAELRAAVLWHTIVEPAALAWPDNPPPITNYGDYVGDQTWNANDWPMDQAAVGAEASPELYLWHGQRHAGDDPTRQRLEDTIDIAQSASMPVVPWVASPTWGGDRTQPNYHVEIRPLWAEQIVRLYDAGVREFLYFNPAYPFRPTDIGVEDDAFAAAVWAGLMADGSDESSMAVMGGDANLDGRVDSDDFLIWQSNFGTQAGATWTMGDFTGDGRVDGKDFLIWQANYRAQTGATWVPGEFIGDGRVDGEAFLIWQANFTPAANTAVLTAEPAEPLAVAPADYPTESSGALAEPQQSSSESSGSGSNLQATFIFMQPADSPADPQLKLMLQDQSTGALYLLATWEEAIVPSSW